MSINFESTNVNFFLLFRLEFISRKITFLLSKHQIKVNIGAFKIDCHWLKLKEHIIWSNYVIVKIEVNLFILFPSRTDLSRTDLSLQNRSFANGRSSSKSLLAACSSPSSVHVNMNATRRVRCSLHFWEQHNKCHQEHKGEFHPCKAQSGTVPCTLR